MERPGALAHLNNQMTTESFEELRQRMLRDADVQEMIHARAYEIYLMRGLQPGGAAQDWFQAESEVLAFLLANHDEQLTDAQVEPVAPSTSDDPPEAVVAASSAETSPEPAAPKKPRQRAPSKATSAKKATSRKAGSKKAVGSDSKPKRSRKKSKPEDKPI